MKWRKYLSNCFLLLVPVLLWNVALTSYLPESYGREVFWKDIPDWISYGENGFRMVIMILPAVMVISIQTKLQRAGLILYLIGVLFYGLSWLVLIMDPDGVWSRSAIGFTAPAYTPVFWLIGIGLVGNQSFFRIKYLTLLYILLSLIFVTFHTGHAYLIFQRV